MRGERVVSSVPLVTPDVLLRYPPLNTGGGSQQHFNLGVIHLTVFVGCAAWFRRRWLGDLGEPLRLLDVGGMRQDLANTFTRCRRRERAEAIVSGGRGRANNLGDNMYLIFSISRQVWINTS